MYASSRSRSSINTPPSVLPEATEADRQLVRDTEAAIGATAAAASIARSASASSQASCNNFNNRNLDDDDGDTLDIVPDFSQPTERTSKRISKAKKPRKETLRQRFRSLLNGLFAQQQTNYANNNSGGAGKKPVAKTRAKKTGSGRCSKRHSKQQTLENASNVNPADQQGQQQSPAEKSADKPAPAEGEDDKLPEEGDAPSPGPDPSASGGAPTPTQAPQQQQQEQQQQQPAEPSAAEEVKSAPKLQKARVFRGGPTTEGHRHTQEAIFRECRVIPVATLYKKVAMVPGRERLFLSAPSNPRPKGSRMLYDIAYENFRHHSDCNRDFTRVNLKRICSNYCRPSQFRYVY